MDADDPLARTGAGRDVKLLATPDVDRRVVRVGEEQRAAGDAAKERHRLSLRRDLGRDALEASAQAQCTFRARLLRPVAVDGG